jgi:hypothetical protein
MSRIEVLRTSWLAGPCAGALIAERHFVVEVDDDDAGTGADVVVASAAHDDLASLGEDLVRWARRVVQRGAGRLVLVVQVRTAEALTRARAIVALARPRLRAVRVALHLLLRLGSAPPHTASDRARFGRSLSLVTTSHLESLTVRGER